MSRFTDLFQSPAPELVKEVKVEKPTPTVPTPKVVVSTKTKEESA